MDDMATRQVGSQEGNNEPDVLLFIVFSVLVGLPSRDDGDGEITRQGHIVLSVKCLLIDVDNDTCSV